MLDGAGTVQACTPRALELLGGADTAPSGLDLPSLVTDPAVWDRLAGAAAAGRDACARVTLRRPGGGRLDVDAQVSSLTGDGGARFLVRLLPAEESAREDAWGMRVALSDDGLAASDPRAQQRLDLLHGAAVRIGGSLDVTANAREAVELLVPVFADYGAVDLTEDMLAGREPGHFEHGTPLRRVAVAAASGIWPEDAYGLGEPITLDRVQAEHARLGAAGVIADLAPVREAARNDPRQTRLMLPDSATCLLVFPLQARGAVLGAVALWRCGDREPFGSADGSLVEEIGSRLALGLDNARRYTRERRTVESLQLSLLPPPVTRLGTAETAGAYAPASTAAGTGGSWYDVIRLSGARVAFVVGRVAGHGVTAAGTMGRLRSAVQTLADLDPPPEELLGHLDDLVTRIGEDEHREDASAPSALHGATCLYAVHDPVSGQCRLASAGHPAPVLVRGAGDAGDVVKLQPGPALGGGTEPFEPLELLLSPGDVLAFHSGPLTGRGQDTERELRDLCDAARGAAGGTRPLLEVAEHLRERLRREPRPEDIALLLARVGRVAPADTAFWELPADPAQVAHARSLAAGQLAHWGLDELAFTTEMIVSELVTNAVRYAGGPVGLRLTRHDRLICEVTDPSQSQPYLRRARLSDEGGRGLFLVAQMTHRWGSRYHPGGKTIWTEQLMTPPG
ncbi:SpoIIE family protein phosphatase [Streptomyces sp. NPDC003344]|uniref:ATP-binding SpoIIE family protein phosphatase n=1 Tax=Streptomyces sp. NPDC003344 TaxID=3364682 RepID=UPI0036BF069E